MKIICLIGPSGCGKTTIGNMLKEKGIPEIVSHTTRAPRVGEENGVTYYFVSQEEFEKLDKIEEVTYAGNKYCTSFNEIEAKSKKSDTLYVIVTYDGYLSLHQAFPGQVVSVYVEANKEQCIERMKARGDKEENIQKRIINFDNMDEFNNMKKCDYVFHNNHSYELLPAEIDKMLDVIKN